MNNFQKILSATLALMVSVLIVWNFTKAVGEMVTGARKMLRLQQLRAQGNSAVPIR